MTEEEFKIQMALLAKDDPEEIDNIKQVRSLMDSHSPWERNRIAMHLHTQYERPRHFLRWSTIQMTMFVGNAPYIRKEWEDLMCSPDFHPNSDERRWRGRRLDCPYFGRPVRSDIDRKTTGDFIRHAHTLNEFEQKTRSQTEKFDSIFEFGGGYGALCFLIHKLGFMGKYQFYDFPEMELLQQYYLSNTIGGGIDTEWTDLNDVDDITNCENEWKTDLFIAGISLSEAPIHVRNLFLSLVDANHYYITYLPTHDGVANHAYFNEYREKTAGRIDWIDWVNPHKKNIRYLYGRKI